MFSWKRSDGLEFITMSHRLTKEELDAQFDQFLRESVSDDSVDMGSSRRPSSAKSGQKSPSKSTVLWWQDEEHNREGTGREQTTRRFLKSRRPPSETDGDGQFLKDTLGRSHSIQEEDDDPGGFILKEENVKASVLSREATKGETEDVCSDSDQVPAVNMMAVGMDTLEEEEEKADFFAHLEAGASSSIDYSKLNRELGETLSTGESLLRKAEEATEQSDEGFRKPRLPESPSPGSPTYSEDFEDEEKEKETQNEEKNEDERDEEKPALSSIMAKVSLFDTLDDTGGDDRRKDTGESLDKGNVHVKSGGSDAEALHEAYRQIHVVETSDDFGHYQHTSSAEGRGKMHDSRSPAPPYHQDRQSLQQGSTNESDLPTAEELMRPIRIDEDHIRGFTLQPVSAGEQAIQGKPFSDGTYTKPMLKLAGKEGNAARLTNIKDLTHHPSDPQNLLNNEPMFSIREEVEKLMEDHKKAFSLKSSQTQKSKKQMTSRVPTNSRPALSSVRKPSVIPSRGNAVEKRTSSRWSYNSRGAATTRPSSVQQPLKPKPTKNQEKENHTEPSSNVSSELVSSVQSLVTVLQQQMGDSSPQNKTVPHYYPPEITREDESSLVTHLRLQLSEKEHELQFMAAAAEEVHSLRQQMYLLQSKLRSAEEVSQTNRWAEATDSTTEATLKQMEKELKEQETLIKGYQQENEKLYLEVKDQKAKTKANHEAMFRENQHLLSELNYLKEHQSNITRLVGNTQLKDHAQRMADLLAQIQTLQRNEALLSEELHRLKQEKQALDVDLQLMKKERDLAIAQVISSTGDRSYAVQVLEDTHSGEVSALRKKLQWFTDNQELQDRDAARLGAAAAEIQQLKEQVEKLKLEVSKNSSQQQRKAKEKSLDLRKMHDLQRQVKELEHILRSRNPNSLPALIYAAAKAENEEEAASQTKKVTDLLEHRIQCLEAELESHDEEAKCNLRAMEQRFHNVKVRYEQQILKMEQKLLQKQVGVPIPAAEEKKVLVKSLEAELQQIRESHMEKEKILQEQIKSLQQQIKSRAQSPSRHQRQAEVAFGVRIERMSQELSTKTRTIQELSRTVERLQRERRYMLSAPHPRKEVKCTENKQQHATPSKTTTVSSTQTCRETFPAAHDERIYQPTVYAGSHISEVLQENTALIQRLKMLEEEQEQEKEALQADAAKAREELHRHQERAAEQISSLKAQHLRELDQQRATHAIEHSSSKVAEQANWIDTQKIQLKHLQEQLKELQGTKDALALSMTRESVLEKQLMRLFKELQEAKDAQSTEVKLLSSLEKKVVNLEFRHQHRETLINQRISGSWQMLESSPQSAEVERWKSVAQEKCKEIETFRLELDSILDIIRHLQRQGVVFPPPGQSH